MSCSTWILTLYLPFITAILKSKGLDDVALWKECNDLMLRPNYLELVICMVSDRCHDYFQWHLCKFAGLPMLPQLQPQQPSCHFPLSAHLIVCLVLTVSSVSGIEPCRKCLQGSPGLGGEQSQYDPALATLEVRASVI